MRENIIKTISFEFAVRIVKLSQYLREQKKEFVLSKQLIRSGTSVGAMVREAEHAESKSDFKHNNEYCTKRNQRNYILVGIVERNGLSHR